MPQFESMFFVFLLLFGSVLLLAIKWNIFKSLSRKWVLGLVLPSISIFILFFFLSSFISVSCHYYFILLANFLIWGTLCSKLLSKCEYVIARELASLGVLGHVRILLYFMLVFVIFFIRCHYGNVYAMVDEDDPIFDAMVSGSAESVSSSTALAIPGGAASGSNTPEVSRSLISVGSDVDNSGSPVSGDDTIVASSSSVEGVHSSDSGETVKGSKSSTDLAGSSVSSDAIVASSPSLEGAHNSNSGEITQGSVGLVEEVSSASLASGISDSQTSCDSVSAEVSQSSAVLAEGGGAIGLVEGWPPVADRFRFENPFNPGGIDWIDVGNLRNEDLDAVVVPTILTIVWDALVALYRLFFP